MGIFFVVTDTLSPLQTFYELVNWPEDLNTPGTCGVAIKLEGC